MPKNHHELLKLYNHIGQNYCLCIYISLKPYFVALGMSVEIRTLPILLCFHFVFVVSHSEGDGKHQFRLECILKLFENVR